jgi:hypothetical protein
VFFSSPANFARTLSTVKGGKNPEKNIMFCPNPKVGLQHRAALLLALFEGLVKGRPVAGNGF